MKYKAFISYSHAVDGHLAPAIQKTLQTLAKPWYKQKVFDIFRDETDLSTSPYLWGAIEDALKESGYLILMASPESAKSKWVKKEIDFWLKHKSINTILIALTEGIIEWDEKKNDFDWIKTTALPGSLKGKYKGEPNYANFIFAKNEDDLSLDSEEFDEAIRPIAATLHDKTVKELFGEIKKQHKKTLRLRNSIILVLLVFLFLLTFFGIKFYVEKRRTQIQLAMNYWEIARKAREEGNDLYSFHLFAEAVKENPDSEFHKTLLLDMNDYWQYLPLDNIFNIEMGVDGSAFNHDNTRILTCSHNWAQLLDVQTGRGFRCRRMAQNKERIYGLRQRAL